MVLKKTTQNNTKTSLLNKLSIEAKKGFTFVEIVVVLGIFAVISSVTLFNFGDFSAGVSLQNLSQQIALQVSSMQRSTLAGKQPFSLSSGVVPQVSPPQGEEVWTPSYGLCFTNSSNGCHFSGYGSDGQVTAFSLFADSYNDKKFSVGETLDDIQISGGDFIYKVCVDEQTGTPSCVSEAIVVFERPNISPDIRYGNDWVSSASDLTVKIESQQGSQREIVIWKSGHVEVN
jgi:prepilin-type N-terminal cleavage/methylation domain-containing protein